MATDNARPMETETGTGARLAIALEEPGRSPMVTDDPQEDYFLHRLSLAEDVCEAMEDFIDSDGWERGASWDWQVPLGRWRKYYRLDEWKAPKLPERPDRIGTAVSRSRAAEDLCSWADAMVGADTPSQVDSDWEDIQRALKSWRAIDGQPKGAIGLPEPPALEPKPIKRSRIVIRQTGPLSVEMDVIEGTDESTEASELSPPVDD